MNVVSPPDREGGSPYLEHFPQAGGSLERVPLDRFPFQLGRNRSAHLIVHHPQVSKVHAEIVREDGQLFLCELGSTNGTFLNGQRVDGRAPLRDGDIIHLGAKEFRFGYDSGAPAAPGLSSTAASTSFARPKDLRSLIKEGDFLSEMISGRLATSYFQPIVTLADRLPMAYEALGRGQHRLLPPSPGPLFALADQCQLAVPLSRLFRQVALADSRQLRQPHLLFLNVHPQESADSHFQADLAGLSEAAAGRTIVLEIHEGFVAEVAALQRLRAQVHDAGLRLAYDDFGVGQARLTALAQCPADYVKLDRTIVQSLPHSRPLRELVRALGQVCADQGTLLLAEGVELEEEASIAGELGCQLGQGYLFAHPMPISQINARPLLRVNEAG